MVKEFFGETLKYDVWSGKDHIDLCKADFEQKLEEVQSYLKNKYSSSQIDRWASYAVLMQLSAYNLLVSLKWLQWNLCKQTALWTGQKRTILFGVTGRWQSF